MKKRLIIVFMLLLALILVVTIQNNKNSVNNQENENKFNFKISENFINDLDKELKNINLSKNKNYIKKTGEFKIEEFSIPCTIKNEIDENDNTKTYLRLPAWIIRYTDIENQKVLLSETRQDSNSVNLVLKDITISENEARIQGYELQEGSTNKNARMDFMFLFLEESKEK